MRLLLALSLVACRPVYDGVASTRLANAPAIGWRLVDTLPHDTASFTEGLVFDRGVLYESSGGAGTSALMKIDAATGRTMIRRDLPRPNDLFAEGLALTGETLVQLTWKNGVALTWKASDLSPGGRFTYAGEGWGLCTDERGFWRSDGSATLHRHAPDDFHELVAESVRVSIDGHPIGNLNELECVSGDVYANVWQTPYVVVFRPATAETIGVLDFSKLVRREGASGPDSVLNGIAWDGQRFYVTGKNWGHIYIVELER